MSAGCRWSVIATARMMNGSGDRLAPWLALKASFVAARRFITRVMSTSTTAVSCAVVSSELFIPLAIALVVAAVSGYAAIAWLLAALRRVGLAPFAVYCLAVGLVSTLVF